MALQGRVDVSWCINIRDLRDRSEGLLLTNGSSTCKPGGKSALGAVLLARLPVMAFLAAFPLPKNRCKSCPEMSQRNAITQTNDVLVGNLRMTQDVSLTIA